MPEPTPEQPEPQPARPRATSLRDLPGYSKSLLRVAAPVSVRLATKKLAIGEIVSLAPGAILTFDKSCDDPLEMYVGDTRVAVGDAVKVGDKFGLRVTQVVMPREHFKPVQRVG